MWTEIYIFELEFSRFTSEIKTERTLKFNILWKKKKKNEFSASFVKKSHRLVLYNRRISARTRLSAD